MNLTRNGSFPTITHRVLWGLHFVLSDKGCRADESKQAAHDFLQKIIDLLGENPALLSLPEDEDQSYPWLICNNQLPELNAVYLDIFSKLNNFYQFLYVAFAVGAGDNGTLTVAKAALKAQKAAYKDFYDKLLAKAGITASADKTAVTLRCENVELAKGLQALAGGEGSTLSAFIRCAFAPDDGEMLSRVEELYGYQGLLTAFVEKLNSLGYSGGFNDSFGRTAHCFSYKYCLPGTDVGFKIEYNARKTQQFAFGTLSGVGEKKMLEDFDNLPQAVQKHFIDICRPCSRCGGCTKGGKNKYFTVDVRYEGNVYSLCPQFPCHEWASFTPELADTLLVYLETQRKYAVK